MITYKQVLSPSEDLKNKILRLLNVTQGDGLFAMDYVDRKLANDYVVGAFDNNQLIGVGIARAMGSEDYEYYTPFTPEIRSWFQEYHMGSFDTLAIEDAYRGQGIGQAISRMRLKWLKEKGCNRVIGVSWVSGLAHTSNRVFEKMGFKAFKKVENFYGETSLKYPFDCPGCKVHPCACAAILYVYENL